MAADVHALVLEFNYAQVSSDMATTVLVRRLDIAVATDSRTVFNVVAKDGATAERRLQIYIVSLRKAYARGEARRKLGYAA